jgi:hypothetical protein
LDNTTQPRPSVFARVNVTAVLLLVALVNLVVHRALAPLLLAGPALAKPWGRALASAGNFSYHLTTTLGLALFASSFVSLLRERVLFPRSLRFAASVFSLFFVALVGLGLSYLRLPEKLAVQLKTSHAFLCWFVAAAIWRLDLRARVKVGATLLCLPSVLHAAALFIAQMGWTRHADVATKLARAGEVTLLGALALAPFLLPRTRLGGGRLLVVWAAGLLCLLALAGALLVDFDLAQAVARHALRLELPAPGTGVALAYGPVFLACALGCGVLSGRLLVSEGRDRLMALGALLTAVAGYQLQSPAELVTSACGMLAVAAGAGPLANLARGGPSEARLPTAAQTTTP